MAVINSGLVEQLQADALDEAVPITVLLRKAKTTAVKLKQSDIAEWIEHEMSGYPGGINVPDYRNIFASMKFWNPYRGWCPVVGGDRRLPFHESMAEITALLSGKDGGAIVSTVPMEIAERVCAGIGFTADVKMHISRAAVAAIGDAVRNTVHDWVLKLEQAGIRGEGLSFSAREAEQAKSVVINIGSIGNATGIGSFGDQATITATQSIDVRQLAGEVRELVSEVSKRLETSGLTNSVQKVAASQLQELREAIDQKNPDEGRIKRGLANLKGTMENAAGNLIASGVVALIAKILGG